MLAPKKILVPTDFSISSENALEKALRVAQKGDAEVYLLHVVDSSLYERLAREGVCDGIIQNIRAVHERNVQKMLQRCIDGVPGARKDKLIVEIRNGSPVETILKDGEEKAVDLIMIGARSRTSLMRRLLGGISEKIREKATCQVSVLQPA